MEQKKAIHILIKMLEKYPLEAEEKEAVLTAIGVLGWTSLSRSTIKALREKKEKAGREAK